MTSSESTPTPQRNLPDPPQAQPQLREINLHGQAWRDEYYWLREKDRPEVLAYLQAENDYTDKVLEPLAGLREKLYEELLGRIKQSDESVPFRQGDFYYFSRTEEGKQYPIYCRRPINSGEDEFQVILDVNALAADSPYMDVGFMELSDDGRHLAYSTDQRGFREYTLHIKDLFTGEMLADVRRNVDSVAWSAGGETLFYTVEDQAKRAFRVFRMTLGNAEDVLIYEEADERFRVYVSRTLSGEYLVLNSRSHTSSEVRFLPANAPFAEWTLVEPRQQEHRYDVAHHGVHFYIRTNAPGRNFCLVRVPVQRPGRKHWEIVVPHRADVMLEGMLFFAEHSVLVERQYGLPQFRATHLSSGREKYIRFPESAYHASVAENRQFTTRRFRYNYSSLITPLSVFEFDMQCGESHLLKQTEVLGGYDAGHYQSERLFAKATDGTCIPISLVYCKDRRASGPMPTLLTGYGAYGLSLNPVFSSNRISLLDRGVAFAIAHVRGGGELGKSWHDSGRMLNKENSFSDFVAVAEQLIHEGFTSSDRLAIQGGSAGGLLVGAVVNRRPELFCAAVLVVPFVDIINTILDESLPLTIGEFEEWGNPKNKDEFEYMRRYCPYSNLAQMKYPEMLVRASLHDSQVMYWEPAKYVARMRNLNRNGSQILLQTNMKAGHGGSSGRYDYLREVGFDYAYILWRLGVESGSSKT